MARSPNATDSPDAVPPGRTTRLRAHVADRAGGTYAGELVTAIDVDHDPHLFDLLCNGELNVARANSPQSPPEPLAVPVLLHWPSARHAALYLPRVLAHRILEERAAHLERLAAAAAISPHGEPPRWLEQATILIGRRALRAYAPRRPRELAPDREHFRGPHSETTRRPITLRDRQGRTFTATVYTSLDVDADPVLLDDLLAGRLNLVVSPHDGTAAPVHTAVLVHRPSARLCVLFVPDHLAARRLEEHARLLRELATSPVSLPRYVVELPSVTGTRALAEAIGAPPPPDAATSATSSEPQETASRVTRTESSAAANLVAALLDEPGRIQLGLPPIERVGGPTTRPHQTNTALHLVASAPERFPAPPGQESWLDASRGALPLLALRIRAGQSSLWAARDIRFLIQLHDLDVYPLVALVVAAVGPAGEIDDELYHPLDVAKPADRAVLEGLAAHFAVTVAFYGTRGALEDAARFIGPLESNVRGIVERAERRLERAAPDSLDLAGALERFAQKSFPRIGTMRHPFAPGSFSDVQSPGEAVLAASIISYWNQDPNLRYLLFNQSFSQAWFEQIRNRVIDACVRFGIRLPPVLRRLAAPDDETARELVARLLASFAEVQLALRTNDLDPVALWENWRLLLEDADDYGLIVEPGIMELARAALEDARRHQLTLGLDD